jgi:superfamily II DNA or RNA helicase
MSGTIPPENTLEGMKIRSHAGDVICQVSASQLSEKGLIAMPKFYFIQCKRCTTDLTGYNPGTFQKFFIKGIVNNEYRNELIYEIVAENPNKKITIIVQFIEHGEILFEMLKRVASCNYIHGNTENNFRTIEDFNLNKFNVLIGSSVIDEGITFPSIDILILAAGGKGGNSSRQLAQRIGRGLDPSHKEVSIFDFDDIYHYVFKAHSRKRRKYIESQGFSVKLIDKPINIGD